MSAGASAIGLNFFPKSRRFVNPDQARRIAEQTAENADIVGVFVNHPPQQVAQLTRDVGLTAVQFHGDERRSDIEQFQRLSPQTPVIRAFRISAESTAFTVQWQEFSELRVPLAAALVDAWSATEYGGTGKTVSADLLKGHQLLVSQLILAGGLTPGNVAEAVSRVQPWGVDTASGVEISPGIKSTRRVHEFVSACRAACPDQSMVRIATGQS